MIGAVLLLTAAAARAEWTPEFARGAQKVRAALDAGRREEAAAAAGGLEVPAKAHPADAVDMLRKRAELRVALDDLRGAEADLRAALAAAPGDFQVLCELTQFLRERGRYTESLAVAQALAGVTAGIPPANRAEKWLQRAETLMRLGRYDDAADDVGRALRDKPEDVPSLWLMAQVHLRAGRPGAALPYAERMLAAASTPKETAGAYAQRAQVRSLLGDAKGAEADVAAGLRADPADHVALEARVQRLRDEGRFQEALALSDKMVASGATAPPTRRALLYEQRAEVERMLGDAARAEADFRAALDIEPDSQPALRRYAEFLLDAQRPAEAARAASRYLLAAAEGSPTARADGLSLRARAYAAAGLAEQAEADRAEARRLAPDSAAALRDSAAAALAAGDAARSLALAESWLKAVAGASAAERAEALLGRGSARLAVGQRAEAEADFAAAAALAPGSLFARERLTTIALEDGRFEVAETRAEALFAVAGSTNSRSHAAALVLRARARSARGRRAEAVADLTGALAADPSSRDALSALTDALARSGFDDQARAAMDGMFASAAAATAGDEPALKAMTAVVAALTRLGRADLALADAEVLLRRAPGRAESLCARAGALEALGRGADALKDLDAAAASSPGDRETRRLRARLLARSGRGREALAAADQFVAVSTAGTPAQAAEAYLWRADRRADAGDPAGADSDHRSAEAAVPGAHARDADAGARWAAAVFALKGPVAAQELLGVLRRSPSAHAAARAALAAAEAESRWSSGDAAGAQAAMAAALAADAAAACHAPLLGERGKAAPAWFDACVDRLPDDAELLTDRGVSRWTTGRAAQGEADFRAALKVVPGFLPAAMSLASALEADGRKADAARVLETSLASPGADPALMKDAREQLERLKR